MVNRHTSYVNNTLEVLRVLLLNGKPVFYRKLQGFGLTANDFDKKEKAGFNEIPKKNHNVTRTIFLKRLKKDNLVERRLIKLLDSRGNKGKYYSITPLGIGYLCSKISKLDDGLVKAIFNHLKFHYDLGKPEKELSYIDKLENHWTKLCEIFGNETLTKHLGEIFSDIEISKNEDNYEHIECNYETFWGLKIPTIEYQIKDNNVRLILDSSIKEIAPFYYDSNEIEMNYNIAKFVISAFTHDLIHHNFEEQRSYSHNPKHIQKLKKSQMQAKSIPLEIYGLANEFNEYVTDAINKHRTVLRNTEGKIKLVFKNKDEVTIQEKQEKEEAKKLRKQFNKFYEIVQRLADGNKPFTKKHLLEVMLKSGVWKNKFDMVEFEKEIGRDFRRTILEEAGHLAKWAFRKPTKIKNLIS